MAVLFDTADLSRQIMKSINAEPREEVELLTRESAAEMATEGFKPKHRKNVRIAHHLTGLEPPRSRHRLREMLSSDKTADDKER